MSAQDNYPLLQGTRVPMAPVDMGGLMVQVTLDSSDQKVEDKLGALRKAIETILGRIGGPTRVQFLTLAPLDVFFGLNVKCEACWDPEQQGGREVLFLGDRMMFQKNVVIAGQDKVGGFGQQGPRGVAHQVYDDQRRAKYSPARWVMMVKGTYQGSKVSAQAAAVAVHEFGHFLHEKVSQARFWANKADRTATTPAAIVPQVSTYLIGQNNLNEFVAEVFTGLVHGKRYGAAVMNLYQAQGGPPVV